MCVYDCGGQAHGCTVLRYAVIADHKVCSARRLATPRLICAAAAVQVARVLAPYTRSLFHALIDCDSARALMRVLMAL
jgi:hypothetical protein